MKRNPCCTASQVDLAATWRQRIRRACFACQDSRIGNFRRSSSSAHTMRAVRYTVADFMIHEEAPETPSHSGDRGECRRTAPSEHKSQSEHDWAYAKRALARGDDVELVIQRIADCRSDDKDNPDYYARHTVMKAQAELARSSTMRASTGSQIPQGNESSGPGRSHE